MNEFSRSRFVAYSAASMLFLFAVPSVAYWFGAYARSSYDAQVVESVGREVRADATLTAAERAEAIDSFTAVPMSARCAAGANPAWDDLCGDYAQFGWIRLAAAASIGIGLLMVLVTLSCALLAYLSEERQLLAFRTGWNVLRLTSAAQVVLQGFLLVMLSFWMTAVFVEAYFVKLILVAGGVTVVAIIRVVYGIFRKVDDVGAVEGEILKREDAPALFERVEGLCETLETAPPDQVVVGIDDNFFVTEQRMKVCGTLIEGRTLYLSLSLLETMEKEEADAVLAHEMAHFSGGDTAASSRLLPHLLRFGAYAESLRSGMLTLPIYTFMSSYFSLFELALARSQRARELRADAVAAQQTSKELVARALLKVAAYSSYRSRVEDELFGHDRVHDELDIAVRVATGFASYAHTERLAFDLHDAVFPHPFDSHPPLRDRLAAVGEDIPVERYGKLLLEPVRETWLSSIENAEAIEERQWKAYEERFAAVHEENLAYRYEPASESQREIVLKYFPDMEVETSDGPESLHLDHRGIEPADGKGFISFDSIAKLEVKGALTGKILYIHLTDSSVFGRARKIKVGKVTMGADVFLDHLGRYYARHQIMRQLQEPGRS